MNLFVVEDRAHWGYTLNVVRAEDEVHALHIVCGPKAKLGDRNKVMVLRVEGEPGILWHEEVSPSSRR